MTMCVGAAVPASRRVELRSLVQFGVLACVVAGLAASGGSLAGRAASSPHPSAWSQLPSAARGPVAAALASRDPRYRVSPSPSGLTARNPAQGLRLRFSRGGVGVSASAGDLRLALQSVGRSELAQQLGTVRPGVSTTPNRVVYRRAGLSEWYANSPLGLEQGFTLGRRPAGDGTLALTVGLSGSLAGQAVQHRQTISFGSLVYRGLVVTDARGRKLPAHLQLAGSRVLIDVNDRAAQYPVRIDPFLQSAELTASDGAAYDQLGSSVAIDGDTIAVGAPYHTVGSNTSQGAVYVFTKPAGGWADATETAELTASDGAKSAYLGWSVAVSGDTIAVGALRAIAGKTQQGAVYVFTKPAGGWANMTQTAELTASDGVAYDQLGYSVAIDGATITAGAPQRTVGGVGAAGTVYVFTRAGSAWTTGTQTAELTAAAGATGDQLGSSVAISVDTIAAGAPFRTVGGATSRGAVYVFTKPVSGWANGTQTATLTASDGAAEDRLGNSVAITSNTVAAGAPAHAVGANPEQGAVYVFPKPANGWTNATQTAELTASDGAANDQLGYSVAASNKTITAGAPERPAGDNDAQGVVYVFTKPGAGWADGTQAAELTASDGDAGDQFGSMIAISGSTIAASSPYRTVGGNLFRGAVYSFTFAGPTLSTTQQPASATVGSTIADQATLAGALNPTGTITFRLYDNPDGTGTPVFTDTEPLLNNGATSAGYATTTPATYYWVATYNGDANNPPLSSGTADEPVIVKATPTLSTTQQPSSITIGSSIADQATVTGFYNPTGTVTFRLYGNASASGTPLFTDTKTLANGIAVSASYAPLAAGTYYWVASYSGDADNFSATSSPGGAPVSVTLATPSVSTTQQPATAAIGSPIADKATISGGYNPTGTVTFRLYTNSSATGSPVFGDTQTLVNGVATSATYAPTATGTYYWVATCNGDGNNNAAASGTADEPVPVTKATPSISTTQQPATVAVESPIADKATLSGGYSPTGTVTFKLYDNATATGPALFTDTEALASGSATSATYATTAVGTYYWVATYNGDSNNNGTASGPADEPVSVTKPTPSISTTQQPASATIGSSFADHATVSGGASPTGSVTFDLYDNATAAGAPLFSDTELLVSGSATSTSYTPTAAGTYYWVATYNGDGNNNTVSTAPTAAPATVTKAAPSIAATQQPAAVAVGASIADQATVSAGHNPTGTVTFTLYANSSATGSPVFTDTEPLANGSATSAPTTAALAGTYYWVATYDGDANNATVSSGPADDPVTVAQAKPRLVTKRLPASAKKGKPITDKAVVAGGYNPSGKITFRLYKNRSAKGKPLFTSTARLSHGAAMSAKYKPKKTGKYYWVATYTGDANNKPVSSGRSSQPVSVHR